VSPGPETIASVTPIAPMFLAYLPRAFQNPGALENLFNQFTTEIAGTPYCVRTLTIA